MRNLANLFVSLCLLSLPASSLAQQSDPFGADPFGGGKAKPRAVKQPQTEQVAQPKGAKAQKAAKASQQKAAGTQAARKPRMMPAPGSSVAELRIRSALGDETTQNFVNLPLEEAVHTIAQTHDIPIVVDKRALEDVGLAPDTPVNLSLRNVTLRSFLRLMLRELELTYIVKDEVMQITTLEVAEQNLDFEMYTFSKELTEKSDRILKALTSSVEPDAWDVNGGPCSVTAIDNVLIVSAPESIHQQVIEFLHKLQQAFDADKN